MTLSSATMTDARVVIEAAAMGPKMEEATRYKRPVSITFRAYMDPA